MITARNEAEIAELEERIIMQECFESKNSEVSSTSHSISARLYPKKTIEQRYESKEPPFAAINLENMCENAVNQIESSQSMQPDNTCNNVKSTCPKMSSSQTTCVEERQNLDKESSPDKDKEDIPQQ